MITPPCIEFAIWYRVIAHGIKPKAKGNTMKLLRSILRPITSVAGFTMIELLIVISILGILAVAVLSAINPVEQINRGRDTGSQSDSEQLISAIDRYNAFQGYFPWQNDPTEDTTLAWLQLEADVWIVTGSDPDCDVFTRLGSEASAVAGCTNSNEVKTSFISRITSGGSNPLFVYNAGATGDSTYVCFTPKSDAFKSKAANRCQETTEYGSLPGDFPEAAACVADAEFFCLP
ncbi:MAG: hypothetical protein A3A82_01855 [Candidatus Pacebacteria bacterium RIFCSPLOWO2_01_FULL_47_12]|nr:MAG: hypothetical protein A3A82_01855 [Candidatus Pacebacteria bacterium RIFCSPLOWO2_01_FULL_47_12]